MFVSCFSGGTLQRRWMAWSGLEQWTVVTIITCVGAKASTATPACLYIELDRSVFLIFFLQNIMWHIRLCTTYSNPTDVKCGSSVSILTILFACRDQRSLVGTVIRTTWSASLCSSSQRLSLSCGKVHSFSLCCLWKSLSLDLGLLKVENKSK